MNTKIIDSLKKSGHVTKKGMYDFQYTDRKEFVEFRNYLLNLRFMNQKDLNLEAAYLYSVKRHYEIFYNVINNIYLDLITIDYVYDQFRNNKSILSQHEQDFRNKYERLFSKVHEFMKEIYPPEKYSQLFNSQ